MPHNNSIQHDHAYLTDRILRPTPTVASDCMLVDPYSGATAPHSGMLLPQDQTIHRGSPGSFMMFYVPTAHPATAGGVPAPRTAALPVHMVPSHYEDPHHTHHHFQSVYSIAPEHQPNTPSPRTVTSNNHNHIRPMTEPSFDGQQEAAQTILQLASATQEDDKREGAGSPSSAVTTVASPKSKATDIPPNGRADSSAAMNGPFKKRKLVSEIMRSKKDQQSTFQVSPISHGSKTACSPDRSQSSSYDEIKGGQVLPDSAKISEGKSLIPPTTVFTEADHFPTQLYQLLSASPSSGESGALQWCCNGKAWRIVRWDALRKSILPKYFNGCTLDSFLAELSSWGFTEMTNGKDAGAYSHTLFRKGFPNLCKEIRYIGVHNQTPNGSNSSHSHETRTPTSSDDGRDPSSSTAPSILQVPSLGDAVNNYGAGEDKQDSHKTDNSPMCDESVSTSGKRSFGQISSTASPAGNGGFLPYHHQNQPAALYIPYRHEGVFTEQQQSSQEHQASLVWTSVESMTPPTLPAYSPVRVRSGRGGARMQARLPAQVTPNPSRNSAFGRSMGFPVVSNRGRRIVSGKVRSTSVASAAASLNSTVGAPTASSVLRLPSPIASSMTTVMSQQKPRPVETESSKSAAHATASPASTSPQHHSPVVFEETPTSG